MTTDHREAAEPKDVRQRGAILKVAAGAVALVVLSSVTGAYAAHQFSDVPNTNPFHQDISNVADAGVVTGFEDGTFKPSANVSRQALAAMLGRGLTRVAYDEGDVVNLGAGTPETEVTDVVIEAGAADGGGGFVVLDATIEADPNGSVTTDWHRSIFWIRKGGTSQRSESYYLPWIKDNVSGAVSWVVPIQAGQTLEFDLVVQNSTSPSPPMGYTGTLRALYVPFGYDGGQDADDD